MVMSAKIVIKNAKGILVSKNRIVIHHRSRELRMPKYFTCDVILSKIKARDKEVYSGCTGMRKRILNAGKARVHK
jgi:hypothetical protein